MSLTTKQKQFIISVLRQATFKWKPRGIAKNLAKVKCGEYSTGRDKFKYKCAICGELFMSKDTVMDHKDPVVPIKGYKSGMDFDLNEYAERMFCAVEGWQVLCSECHDQKTREEKGERKT